MVRLIEWDVFKPLTTEPPLDPPVTEYDRIEARRFDLYKKGLLEEEQLHDSLEEEELMLQMEHESMQWLDDDEDDDWCMPFSESIERKD